MSISPLNPANVNQLYHKFNPYKALNENQIQIWNDYFVQANTHAENTDSANGNSFSAASVDSTHTDNTDDPHKVAPPFENSLEEPKPLPGKDFSSFSIQEDGLEETVSRALENLDDDSVITEEWLTDNPPAAQMIADNKILTDYLNDNPDAAEEFIAGKAEGQAVIEAAITDNLLRRAVEQLDQETPITEEWLSDNLDIAGLIADKTGFADYLNENTEQAQALMEETETVKDILKDMFEEQVISNVANFFDGSSSVTEEWMNENFGTTLFLSNHPGFSQYLSSNPDQAENFVDTTS